MERFSKIGLIVLAFAFTAGEATAQRRQRVVYNPVTGQSEPEHRERSQPARTASPAPAAGVETPAVEQASLLAPACECDDPACLGDCAGGVCPGGACGDLVGCGGEVTGCSPPGFFAGFEFTFVKPRFENNVAFTTTTGVAAGNNDTISDTEFDYDLELTPRVYAGVRAGNGVAFRATWWQFDHAAAPASGSPATAFDEITHPAFGTVNIGTTDPTETFAASSSLEAYAIDLEAVRETSFCGWDLEVGGGVRYASTEQGYSAALTDAAGGQVGNIDFVQSLEGIGPTISLGASTPLTKRLSLYSKARGSLLFGDGESRLSAVEDSGALTTSRTTNRDDLLSIAEVQLGFRWQGQRRPRGLRRPFATFAMEGQVWDGAGTATSEEGSLGFFGFTTELGLDW